MAITVLAFRGTADPDWVTPTGLLPAAPDPQVAGCTGLVSIVGHKTGMLLVSWAPGRSPDETFLDFWLAQAATAGLVPGVASISVTATTVTEYGLSEPFKGVPCQIIKKK